MAQAYEIDFLRGGDDNHDAIVIRYGEMPGGDYGLQIVDGGFTGTGDIIIEHIERHFGKGVKIADVVLTHACNDHAPGLIKVLNHFKVFHLWMNQPWLYAREVVEKFHGNFTEGGLAKKMRELHPYLIEMEQIAALKGIEIRAPLQDADIGPFKVLAPSRERYVTLIPYLDKTPEVYEEARTIRGAIADLLVGTVERVKERLDYETLSENPPETGASNESSVVQLGNFGGDTILLTGDVGPEGLNEAADFAEIRGLLHPPSLVQVPHHGSRRNVTPSVLDRWLGKYPSQKRGNAAACVGQKKLDEYPRKKVRNAFRRRGYPVSVAERSWLNFRKGYPSRDGAVSVEPLPFCEDVED